MNLSAGTITRTGNWEEARNADIGLWTNRKFFDIKRAFGIEHPFQALGNDTGGGQRDAVAGYDQAGVAMGASRADVTFINNGHIFTALIEVKGTANTDGAGTDDQGFRFSIHCISFRYPDRISGSAVFASSQLPVFIVVPADKFIQLFKLPGLCKQAGPEYIADGEHTDVFTVFFD